MIDGLFDVTEAWSESPLEPGLDMPTPLPIIFRLTRTQRERRVEYLMQQAQHIHDEGKKLADGKDIVAECILYSGGNDSTTLAHLFKDQATHAIHANTGIGVEETRQFVRDTCARWGLPLMEEHPPTSYRELVMDRGFPGPAMHYKMYQRLKERCLVQARRKLVSNGRQQRVVFIAGRRRAESARRADIPLHERDGSTIWTSPLAMWTKPDMQTYRLMHGDVPVNPVAEALGMSGECLCGAFAKPGELNTIREHYPDVADEIEQLERDVRAAGWDDRLSTWGHGSGTAGVQNVGRMCTSCTLTDPLIELMEAKADA